MCKRCDKEVIDMEEKLKDTFNIEIEMLSATREPMADGRTKISITITDPDKIEYIQQFVLKMISGSPGKNLN